MAKSIEQQGWKCAMALAPVLRHHMNKEQYLVLDEAPELLGGVWEKGHKRLYRAHSKLQLEAVYQDVVPAVEGTAIAVCQSSCLHGCWPHPRQPTSMNAQCHVGVLRVSLLVMILQHHWAIMM